jgi:hypothetical protein
MATVTWVLPHADNYRIRSNQSCFLMNLNASTPSPGQAPDVKRELHLVAAKQVPEPSNTRLELGEHIADIFLDTRNDAKVCHWIIQKLGSPEIVFWGQEYTFDQAKSAAQSYLEELNRRKEHA